MDVKGKVALVTGGSSGIDKATAFAFAHAGATVVVASRRIAEGEETVHEICDRGGDAIFVPTDVSKDNDVISLIDKTLDMFGNLDSAFNNAGGWIMGSLTEQSEEDWERIMDMNLKGTWLCLKYELSAMPQRGSGSVVNMASVAGVTGMAGFSIYSASRGGIIFTTEPAAVEYAKSGIPINSISPGTIKTPALDTVSVDMLVQNAALYPIGRTGQPEEIAEAVVWLCSDKASFVTGHNMVIDGGYTAQ